MIRFTRGEIEQKMRRMTNLSPCAASPVMVTSLWLSLSLVVAGCDGGGGGATCAAGGGTGTLSIEITGLPTGVMGSVSVGADTVTSDTELSLPAGPQEVAANPVAEAGTAIVRNAYGATLDSSTACVRAGQTTTVRAAYLPIPTSGKLWFGTSNAPEPANATLLGFSPASVAVTATHAADRVTNTAGSAGFAFDRDGNVWIIGGTSADPPVARYRASSFSTSGDKFPDVTIDSPSFGLGIPGAQVLAFDRQGNLWVSVVAANKLVKFTPDQLERGGTPTAAVEENDIPAPAGIAFDAAGNLWVAAKDVPAVLRIDVAHLDTSGSGADLAITAMSPPPVIGTLPQPIGLAFDAGGALWVNYDGVIAKLTTADLGGTGTKTITPAIQIATDVQSLPSGMAFDEQGGLWFAYAVKQIARLAPTQLTASGSVTPGIVVTSNDAGSMDWVAIYPAPAALPLWHRLP
jgi:sugar lactone lactonase YvrE